MSSKKKYRLNRQTLLYETVKVSMRSRFIKTSLLFVASFLLAIFFFYIYSSVLKFDLPKTVLLRQENAHWQAKMQLLNRQIERQAVVMRSLNLRDNDIYRNIFGLNELPEDYRNSLYGPENKYERIDRLASNSLLRKTSENLDRLTKNIYTQSKSFKDIYLTSKQAGNMASHVPVIMPILPDRSLFRFSSPFGYRIHPIDKIRKLHTGCDFSCPIGYPVYASGDGVVEVADYNFFGYGNNIIINHGFGYKTRYAHLDAIFVKKGMKVKRGELLGQTGNTGKSSGPHLHYEVLYRNKHVNPYNYFDMDMPLDEYRSILAKAEQESENNDYREEARREHKSKRRRK